MRTTDGRLVAGAPSFGIPCDDKIPRRCKAGDVVDRSPPLRLVGDKESGCLTILFCADGEGRVLFKREIPGSGSGN